MLRMICQDGEAALKVKTDYLQKEVEAQERQIKNLEQFVEWVRGCTTLTELTPYALGALVRAVCVEAPDKYRDKHKQKVHIKHDPVGDILMDERIKAERA